MVLVLKKIKGLGLEKLQGLGLAGEALSYITAYYHALRKKVFGKDKTTINLEVEKLNINLLAKYLQQAGRLAEFGL